MKSKSKRKRRPKSNKPIAGDKEHYEAKIKQAVDLAYEHAAKAVCESCKEKINGLA